jgi:hypothetical protein
MTDDAQSREPKPEPLLDDLGRAITEGLDATAYLWQVPDDADTKARVAALLERIAAETEKRGRREMPRICGELLEALRTTSGPQLADTLQSGFDRLYKLWRAAKSGLV